MNNVILSTKNTNALHIKLRIFNALLDTILGVVLWNIYFELIREISRFVDMGILSFIWVVALLLIACGIFQFYYTYISWASYLEIYDNNIKGEVVHSLRFIEISLKISDINNITIEGKKIYLHTNVGKYKIVSNEEMAKKIMEYYQSIKNK